MPCFVYILASGKNGTLYIGVTDAIARRAIEHKEGQSRASPRSIGSIASSISNRTTRFSMLPRERKPSSGGAARGGPRSSKGKIAIGGIFSTS
jgi:hypothetical protein